MFSIWRLELVAASLAVKTLRMPWFYDRMKIWDRILVSRVCGNSVSACILTDCCPFDLERIHKLLLLSKEYTICWQKEEFSLSDGTGIVKTKVRTKTHSSEHQNHRLYCFVENTLSRFCLVQVAPKVDWLTPCVNENNIGENNDIIDNNNRCMSWFMRSAHKSTRHAWKPGLNGGRNAHALNKNKCELNDSFTLYELEERQSVIQQNSRIIIPDQNDHKCNCTVQVH